MKNSEILEIAAKLEAFRAHPHFYDLGCVGAEGVPSWTGDMLPLVDGLVLRDLNRIVKALPDFDGRDRAAVTRLYKGLWQHIADVKRSEREARVIANGCEAAQKGEYRSHPESVGSWEADHWYKGYDSVNREGGAV